MSKKTKILFISRHIPPDYSGAGRACVKIAVRAEKRQHRVNILTATEDKLAEDFIIKDDKILRINDLFYSNKYTRTISIIFKFINILFLLSKNQRADIYHAFSSTWDSSISTIIIKLIFKGKIIVELTRMGGDNPTLGMGEIFNISRLRRKIVYRLADQIVCLSPQLYNDAIKGGINESKLVLIPRSVNSEKFKPLIYNDKEIAKKKFSFENKYILTFVGSLIHRKGAHLIPDILLKLKEANLDFKCLIIGNNPSNILEAELHDFFKKKIAEYEMQDVISLLGVIEDVHTYLSISDFLLFPSESEGLPNVVLEAMSSEVVPILREVEGLSDYILEGCDIGTGYSDKVDSYSNLILDILNQGNLDLLKSQVRKVAVSKFSEFNVDKEYDKIYGGFLE